MKIENINSPGNQPGAAKNTKASGGSFENVLKGQVKSDRVIENNLSPPHSALNAEQIESVKPLVLQNMRKLEPTGLKGLVKDAFSNIGKQLLNDIDSLCSDESGENIDMELLDELLGLCTENKDELTGGKKNECIRNFKPAGL